jgi:hypothetical protein
MVAFKIQEFEHIGSMGRYVTNIDAGSPAYCESYDENGSPLYQFPQIGVGVGVPVIYDHRIIDTETCRNRK